MINSLPLDLSQMKVAVVGMSCQVGQPIHKWVSPLAKECYWY